MPIGLKCELSWDSVCTPPASIATTISFGTIVGGRLPRKSPITFDISSWSFFSKSGLSAMTFLADVGELSEPARPGFRARPYRVIRIRAIRNLIPLLRLPNRRTHGKRAGGGQRGRSPLSTTPWTFARLSKPALISRLIGSTKGAVRLARQVCFGPAWTQTDPEASGKGQMTSHLGSVRKID